MYTNNSDFMTILKKQNEYVKNNDKEYKEKIIRQINFFKDKISHDENAVKQFFSALKYDNLFYNICDDINSYQYLKSYKMLEINQIIITDFNYDMEEDIISLQKNLYLFQDLEKFLCHNVKIRNEILDFIHGLEYVYENKFIDSDNFYAYIHELDGKISDIMKMDKLNIEFIDGNLCYRNHYNKTKSLIYLIPPTAKYLNFVKFLENDFKQRFLII